LRSVGIEIRADLPNLEGFVDWLRNGWTSRCDTINAPDIPFEETLNAAGRKALKKGTLYEEIAE